MHLLILLIIIASVASTPIIMTVLVHNSPISQARFASFRRQAVDFGLPYDYVNATRALVPEQRHRSLNIAYLAMLDRLQHSGYDRGILCEDDTKFHTNFTTELALSEAAAGDYTILGLCSLFVWAKQFPYTGKHRIDAAQPITGTETDPTGRVFLHWPRFVHWRPVNNDQIWSGAPMCILIKNRPDIINRIQRHILNDIDGSLDGLIRTIQFVDSQMKMLAYPQLCIEDEHGGKVSH